ncbi:ADP-forming succinate--CoA ligase subunit beta [Candidatus Hepatobacter penaei]|uniref:ADP-forming succinate--CoA ligase subunit beta n=1 Tax=Candidatus Hepatobacter penaei TaxID=1274402 RepID=UPI0004F23C26|nr:ADP-forming succinate--CoA ligase subunit beta [Candidatus Hepatobacter penaei]
MDIHEHQAKALLAGMGLPVQKGGLITHTSEVVDLCANLRAPFVVKAQIHAGGRGKGGGIRFAKTVQEAETITSELLGMHLVTPQTGPEGKKVHDVYIVEAADFEQEYYLSFFLNRDHGCVSLMTSSAGGAYIEEIAATAPHKILTLDIDPYYGLKPFHVVRVADFLAWPADLRAPLRQLLTTLYQGFVDKDMSLLEINPLVLTPEGRMVLVDAKITFDDNALYRHPDIAALKDPRESAPQEVEADQAGFSYVQLDGHIGCMVNGAGLAMATMDTLSLMGGAPANFLDVGGSASLEQIKTALRIILSDANVKTVLVNIFGGIMHCDLMAQGLTEAIQTLHIEKPIVVRLAGTHVREAEALLATSGLTIESAPSLEDAARRAVALAKEAA